MQSLCDLDVPSPFLFCHLNSRVASACGCPSFFLYIFCRNEQRTPRQCSCESRGRLATISGRDLREYEASLRGWAGRRADDDNDNYGSRHQGGDSRGDGQPAEVNWKQSHPPMPRMYQHETPVLLHYRCCINCEEYDCSSGALLPNTGAISRARFPNRLSSSTQGLGPYFSLVLLSDTLFSRDHRHTHSFRPSVLPSLHSIRRQEGSNDGVELLVWRGSRREGTSVEENPRSVHRDESLRASVCPNSTDDIMLLSSTAHMIVLLAHS